MWALFEVISLGNVGQFIQSLNVDDRIEIAKSFNIYSQQYDPNTKILVKSIYAIKELRNAVAHNHIIFDCRFKNSNDRLPRNMIRTMQDRLDLDNPITFRLLYDYLALLTIFLKESGTPKSELNAYLSTFERARKNLYQATEEAGKKGRSSLPFSVYNMILGEDIVNKLQKLKLYVAS